ncbi:MarR family winged helix-turn-helix transcriptional regulator [Pseudonocardia sp. DLS-67]
MPPGSATEPLDRLIVRAGLALQRLTRKAAAAHGLSVTALAVLAALIEVEALSHRDLAGRLRLAPATLTPVLDALEGDGALRRVRDGADRRIVRVAITRRGRDRHTAAAAGVARAVGALPGPAMAEEPLIRAYLSGLLQAVDDGMP